MIETNKEFCGVAFVSFNTENEKQEILDNYKLGFLDRI